MQLLGHYMQALISVPGAHVTAFKVHDKLLSTGSSVSAAIALTAQARLDAVC